MKIIKNTKNSCCFCKGSGKVCDDGGAWLYCEYIPELCDNKEYDETGEKDGCDMFIEKSKECTLSPDCPCEECKEETRNFSPKS